MAMYNRNLRAWREAPALASAMPDASPMVSIIVPTRDRRVLLSETIDSVCAQTYDNWELVVVDDASTDGTAEFVRDLEHDDARVKFVSLACTQTGAPAARNLGVSHARGPLIVFLDSDDLLAPSCMARRVEVML